MKGVAKIIGPKNPKIGEENFYEVTEFHRGTVVINPDTIKWKIFKKKDGSWQEAMGNRKTGKRVSYNFSQRSFGHELLVEAYIYNPEIKAPPGIIVKPALGIKKIVSSEILDTNGHKITIPPKYGQSITLKVCTENMLGETLKLSIWERDTLSDNGHDPKDNTQLWSGISKKIDNKGIAKQKVVLSANMLVLAKKGMFDGAEHEYYLLVEADKTKAISATTKVSTEKILSPGNHKIAERETAPPQETKTVDQVPVVVKNATGVDPIVVSGTTNAVVNQPENIEGILTAYFAKEEFTKETTETAGQHTYKFARDNTNFNKNTVSKIIFDRVIPIEKANKKYAKLLDITNALTATSYKKDDTITFNLYKLGANYIPIKNAPLEEEVYVVAKTFSLNGKEVTINIKEKESILVAAAANLPVLEAKENGAEITALKAIVEAGIAKVKIKLRPKADTDLATWKEKLAGIKDGTHTYTFGSNNATGTVAQKKSVGGVIAGRIKDKLTELKKFAKIDIIEAALTKAFYNKDEQITFDVFKTATEYLWLKAECQGDTKKHEKEFLKKDGEYFEIGKNKCSCNRDITEVELDIILKKIRGSEDTTIFNADNCNLDDKSKKSFMTELNKTLKKYEINTCIRKVHFLAQIYHETDRLRTTLEYASGNAYNPDAREDASTNGNTEPGDGPKYRGRGLMQLTWKNNYKLYKGFSGTDVVTNYATVSDELKIAVDSAGWYFKQGKKLNSGNSWTVPETSFSTFDGSTGKQFNKTTYTYDGTSYAAVDINLLADLDYIDTISWLINGGGNGRTERREYLKRLKEIEFFKCNSNKWHDPVDNPMLCLYSQGGDSKKPWHGSFGPTIRDGVNKHTGMDLFAKPGKNVYSCVKGEVVRSEINASMFGEMIVIKVTDEETFKSRRKNPFVLKYSNKSEIESQNFDHNGPFYLVYAHLKERKVVVGDKVDAGKIIGLTGTSGDNGVPFSTKNPHLHFEIMNVERQAGLEKKCNPGVYLTYKDEDSLTAVDTAEQEEARTDSKFWTQ
jgi:predicted chitinase